MKIRLGPIVEQIAGKSGGIVIQTIKGNNVVKRLKKPRNTITPKRTTSRGYFRGLHDMYSAMPTLPKQSWEVPYIEQLSSGRQRFIKEDYSLLVSSASSDGILSSPAINEPLYMTGNSLGITPTAVRFFYTGIVAPAGWSFQRAIAWVWQDKNLSLENTGKNLAQQANNNIVPLAFVQISNMENGVSYQYRAFLHYLDGNNRNVWGQPVSGTVIPA